MPRLPLPGARAPTTGGAAFGAWRKAQGAWHWGVDLTGAAGATVVAPEAGIVVDVASSTDPERAANTTLRGPTALTRQVVPGIANPWDGYGPGLVLVAGASGLYHLLAHLAGQTVAVGDSVAEGAPVGTLATHVGASQSHVHWEVRRHDIDTLQERQADTVDPLAWAAGAPAPAPAPPPPSGGVWWLLLGLWLATRKGG